jgi:LacI family transcriptional regulator
MAAGAVAVAQQRGISIPDDLSVIGFDNVYFTTYMNPALSTVHYPIDDMGRMAARCVLRDVYGMNGKAIQNRFEPRVVRRASTKGH